MTGVQTCALPISSFKITEVKATKDPYIKAIITDIYDYFGLSDYCHDIGKNKGRGRRGILSKMEALALVKVCMGGLYEGRWVEGSALTGPYVKPLCHGSAFIYAHTST